MTAKVYLPSLPTRWDAATGKQVPSLDLNPAADFGTLQIITSGPQATGDEMDEALANVISAAEDYDYDAGDSVLMVGDSIINAAFISAAMGEDCSPVRCLRWDRKNRTYHEVEVKI